MTEALDACLRGETIDADGTLSLFSARGADVEAVCAAGRRAAPEAGGRRGQLCDQPQHQLHQRVPVQLSLLRLFKGGGEVALGRAAYDLNGAELHRRPKAPPKATEVCLQEVFTLTIQGRPIWTSSRR